LFTKNKAKLLKAMWAKIPSQRVDDYLQSVGSYRGMKAALDWYRANPLSAIDLAPIHTPTLFIAGKKDQAVSRAAVEGAGAFMQGPYQVIVSPKGHWLVEEDYQTVEEAIKSHLQRFAMQV
ncbi:MAG: alpha/beta hydrolase, partial [Proteobacteria bacterium]|nr:alpha/beta hydrolase [Pseudomonadota bacterium]